MPCIGNHEAELDNGPYGYNSYKTRFMLPSNGTSFNGSFYSFQVGSVLFISLDANDVCYQGGGAYNVGFVATTDAASNPVATDDHQYNQSYTGTFSQNADGTLSPGGATPNAQTTWLQQTLAAARSNSTIDWIVVQMHQCALSSSTDNGSDAGIRQAWLPLFAQYEVDLVVSGHDHDYERSLPVRGFAPSPYPGTSTWKGASNTSWPSTYIYGAGGWTTKTANNGATVNTFTPVVVSDDTSSPFDTSQGTVFMVLGGGGTNKRDNTYNSGTANVTTFTQIRVGQASPDASIVAGTKPLPDATEPCAWSAAKDTGDAYGIALFSVDPGTQGGNTTITVTYYHAPTQTSGTPNYSVYDQFELTRPRSDGPPAAAPELGVPALEVAGVMALAGGALLVHQQRKARRAVPVHEVVPASGPQQN